MSDLLLKMLCLGHIQDDMFSHRRKTLAQRTTKCCYFIQCILWCVIMKLLEVSSLRNKGLTTKIPANLICALKKCYSKVIFRTTLMDVFPAGVVRNDLLSYIQIACCLGAYCFVPQTTLQIN